MSADAFEPRPRRGVVVDVSGNTPETIARGELRATISLDRNVARELGLLPPDVAEGDEVVYDAAAGRYVRAEPTPNARPTVELAYRDVAALGLNATHRPTFTKTIRVPTVTPLDVAAIRVFQALDELRAGRAGMAESLLERAVDALHRIAPRAGDFYREAVDAGAQDQLTTLE